MSRIAMAFVTLILGLGVGVNALVAQPPGCYFCGNHFWYNEHVHGNELHSLYDNLQSHGGDWYPYYCGVDHRLCDVTTVLAEAAASLTGVAEPADGNPIQVARLLESFAENGIRIEESEAGVEISASCQLEDAGSIETTTVVLSESALQRIRQAMTPVIRGQ